DFPCYSDDDIVHFDHPIPELEALMRQTMVIRSQFRWDPGDQHVTEVGQLRDDDVVILLYPRDADVAAFLRGERPRRLHRLEPRVPVAVEPPAQALPPVEVRRHFAVMPGLEALAVYKGELVCTNADLVRNAAPSWSPMTIEDIERKTGIVERRYSELGLDEMALRAAQAALTKAKREPRDIGGGIGCPLTGTPTVPPAARLPPAP